MPEGNGVVNLAAFQYDVDKVLAQTESGPVVIKRGRELLTLIYRAADVHDAQAKATSLALQGVGRAVVELRPLALDTMRFDPVGRIERLVRSHPTTALVLHPGASTTPGVFVIQAVDPETSTSQVLDVKV